jgi:hypothetical protein
MSVFSHKNWLFPLFIVRKRPQVASQMVLIARALSLPHQGFDAIVLAFPKTISGEQPG